MPDRGVYQVGDDRPLWRARLSPRSSCGGRCGWHRPPFSGMVRAVPARAWRTSVGGVMSGGQERQPGDDSLAVRFLAQGAQQAGDVAGWLAAFIGGGRRSLDLALYDCRLSAPLGAILAGALRERAGAGVQIRFVYDADKPETPQL